MYGTTTSSGKTSSFKGCISREENADGVESLSRSNGGRTERPREARAKDINAVNGSGSRYPSMRTPAADVSMPLTMIHQVTMKT